MKKWFHHKLLPIFGLSKALFMQFKEYLVFLLVLLFGNFHGSAQCPAGRFEYSYYFDSVTMSTITYSTPYSLQMDIYQPYGDTMSARPVIVLAHGGSFIYGTRNDDVTIDSLCIHFAKRGYVVASIDYRLGDPFTMFLDTFSAITEVVQAISDGKAAIRFFVKDRATTNTYKIDTNNIFIGGNSAGAVMNMQIGYIDSFGACPTDIQTAMTSNGGFEGNSGNAGYTTRFKGIINLAGALNTTSFITPGAKPSVNAQGSIDSTVPYECGYPYITIGHIDVTLCGLGQLEPRYNAEGVYHMSHVFPGQGHIPWASDAGMFITVDSMIQLFLYNLICTPLHVSEISSPTSVTLYPNPAAEKVAISAAELIKSVEIIDQLGRTIITASDINLESYELDTHRLNSGVYLVRTRFTDPENKSVVRRLLIH